MLEIKRLKTAILNGNTNPVFEFNVKNNISRLCDVFLSKIDIDDYIITLNNFDNVDDYSKIYYKNKLISSSFGKNLDVLKQIQKKYEKEINLSIQKYLISLVEKMSYDISLTKKQTDIENWIEAETIFMKKINYSKIKLNDLKFNIVYNIVSVTNFLSIGL